MKKEPRSMMRFLKIPYLPEIAAIAILFALALLIVIALT